MSRLLHNSLCNHAQLGLPDALCLINICHCAIQLKQAVKSEFLVLCEGFDYMSVCQQPGKQGIVMPLLW